MQAGQTLTEMFGDGASHSLVASIGGHIVPREMWNKVRPRAGQTIHAVNYPQGGNGGKALRLVAMVVVAYLSYGTSLYVQGTSYAAYAGVAGLAVSVIGTMAVPGPITVELSA
jgi:hypothetical protein